MLDINAHLRYISHTNHTFRTKAAVIVAYAKHPEGLYAWTVKVGEKGQIVIPKEARDVFGIHPGDTLIVLGDVKQGLAIPPKNTFVNLLENVFGGTDPIVGADGGEGK